MDIWTKDIKESVANEDDPAIKKIFQDARDYRNSLLSK